MCIFFKCCDIYSLIRSKTCLINIPSTLEVYFNKSTLISENGVLESSIPTYLFKFPTP